MIRDSLAIPIDLVGDVISEIEIKKMLEDWGKVVWGLVQGRKHE